MLLVKNKSLHTHAADSYFIGNLLFNFAPLVGTRLTFYAAEVEEEQVYYGDKRQKYEQTALTNIVHTTSRYCQ